MRHRRRGYQRRAFGPVDRPDLFSVAATGIRACCRHGARRHRCHLLGFRHYRGSIPSILLQSEIFLGFIDPASADYLRIPCAHLGLYILHGLWDVAHHRTSLPMPGWYVPLCLVYDVLAAFALWAILLL